MGTDGLLHYTETHHDIFHHNQNKTGSHEFCIEATEDQGNLLMGIENCSGVACSVMQRGVPWTTSFAYIQIYKMSV